MSKKRFFLIHQTKVSIFTIFAYPARGLNLLPYIKLIPELLVIYHLILHPGLAIPSPTRPNIPHLRAACVLQSFHSRNINGVPLFKGMRSTQITVAGRATFDTGRFPLLHTYMEGNRFCTHLKTVRLNLSLSLSLSQQFYSYIQLQTTVYITVLQITVQISYTYSTCLRDIITSVT